MPRIELIDSGKTNVPGVGQLTMAVTFNVWTDSAQSFALLGKMELWRRIHPIEIRNALIEEALNAGMPLMEITQRGFSRTTVWRYRQPK